MSETYSLHIYCHWIDNPKYLVENLGLITLGETPIAYYLVRGDGMLFGIMGVIVINVLGSFSVNSQWWNFYKVEFTHISSPSKKARKIT